MWCPPPTNCPFVNTHLKPSVILHHLHCSGRNMHHNESEINPDVRLIAGRVSEYTKASWALIVWKCFPAQRPTNTQSPRTAQVSCRGIWTIKQQWDHPVLIFQCARVCVCVCVHAPVPLGGFRAILSAKRRTSWLRNAVWMLLKAQRP